jgi:hypothetical protein
MSKKVKAYAVISEYEGGFVGTLPEIDEWMAQHDINLYQCKFWELGKEVRIVLAEDESG